MAFVSSHWFCQTVRSICFSSQSCFSTFSLEMAHFPTIQANNINSSAWSNLLRVFPLFKLTKLLRVSCCREINACWFCSINIILLSSSFIPHSPHALWDSHCAPHASFLNPPLELHTFTFLIVNTSLSCGLFHMQRLNYRVPLPRKFS